MICLVLFHLLSEKFEENKMKSLCFSSSSSLPHLLFCLLVIMHAFPVLLSNPELLYKNCRNEVFKCGDIHAGYPFYGGDRLLGCGHPGLELRCDNDSNTTTIEIVGVKYEVRGIQHDSTILRIAREDFIKNGFCKPQTPIQNSIIDPELFDDDPDYTNVTLFYDCPSSISSGLPQSSCLNHSHYKNVTVSRDNIRVDGCLANVTIPTSQTWWKRYSKHPPFPKALGEEFKGLAVKWKEEWEEACRKCNASRGACGFGFGNQTFCHCPRPYMNWPEFPNECPPPSPAGHKKGVNLGRILGFGIAGAAAIVFFLFGIGILLVRQQRRKKIAAQVISRDLPTSPSSKGKTTSTTNTSQTNSSYYTSRYDIERGSTYFGVHVFDYEELEEATDNFNPSKQLGEGGFGTVYYGVLQDERVVAVKRLYENNLMCVNQYMNEIEILTLLRHPNLVTLYGCTSRRSRELLLVYEYIPNGTVADHLHGKGANSGSLTWNVRLSIAIETATALTYLHKKEIIHRDVKSNNILLDKNFHVKVADFGLSRLFPTDVTHVSTAPQGTPGYVDPEYHQCYHLTEKSDVYSFGVVLVELVSAKKAVDTSRHRHDINLANMAISRIQNQALHELVDPSLGFENDCEVKNSVTAVSELAFRCVQQERELRPSMEEVLETLREIKDVRTEAEVVEIRSDDVGQLKNITPPLPPDYRTDKWARIRSM